MPSNIFILSDVVILLEDVPRVLNQQFLRRFEDVVLEIVERHVVACRLVQPLEVVLEVVRDVLLYVELVDGQAVGYEHGSLG